MKLVKMQWNVDFTQWIWPADEPCVVRCCHSGGKIIVNNYGRCSLILALNQLMVILRQCIFQMLHKRLWWTGLEFDMCFRWTSTNSVLTQYYGVFRGFTFGKRKPKPFWKQLQNVWMKTHWTDGTIGRLRKKNVKATWVRLQRCSGLSPCGIFSGGLLSLLLNVQPLNNCRLLRLPGCEAFPGLVCMHY